MSRKYLCYFMLMLVLAVALAGCTLLSTAPPEKHMGEDTAPLISPPSAVPPTAEQISGQALPARPFDLAKARWAEYKLIVYDDGQPYTSTVRLEYGSSSANGIKTQSIKRTITSDDASINVFGTGNLYSLRVYNAQNSMTSNTLVPFDQLKKDDPVLCADDITAGPSGSESVVVPKGAFDCKKYLVSFKGSDSTYWGAPGVPVPVKVYTACDGTTLELVDWG